MFEYKDNFRMGPVFGLIKGDDSYPFCSISNAAEDELAELAKLVGEGSKLRPAGDMPASPLSGPQEVNKDWTQATEASAPRLNYDLEQELSRAFGTPETTGPVEQAETQIQNAVEQAESPAEQIAEAVPAASLEIHEAPAMAFEQEPEADFDNMVADELDRALAEEVAAEAALDAAMEAEFAASISPQADVADDEAFASELSKLANGPAEEVLQPEVPMPVATEQTLDPWTTPEIVEPTVESSSTLAMPEIAPETEWASQPAGVDHYSDPATDFVATEAQPTVSTNYVAETASIAAVGAGAMAASHSTEYAQAAPAEPVYAAPAEEEIMIPPPHMYDRPTGGGAGKRIALAVVAVALMGGVAAAGWNMFDGADGPAPTILAATEPAKVKPKDSGGKIVPNQDQAVYRSVGGENTAPKQAKLKDSSEKPIKVAAKATPDKTIIERARAENDQPANGLKVQPRRVRTVVVKPDGTIVSTIGKAVAKPLTVAAAVVTEPTLALKPELAAVDAAIDTSTTILDTSAKLPSVTKAARPAPKEVTPQKVPANQVAAKKVEVKKVPVKKVAVKKAPAKKAPVKKAEPVKTASVSSPFAVQISSQRSAAAAQQSYATLSRRYASVIGGKGVDIRKGVVKGKGTYYRVRIPADSRSAANTICSRLKAQGGACFVTR